MTWRNEAGVDSGARRGHFSAQMLRMFAHYFSAFAGFFAPRNTGG
jgi:hypothetical protein